MPNPFTLFFDRYFMADCKSIYSVVSDCKSATAETLSFTQGVAIGIDMFKPFQGISRGYLK